MIYAPCWLSRSRSRQPSRAPGGAWLPQELLARRETLRRAQAQLCQQIERLTDTSLRAVLSLHEYERRRRDLEQRVQALARQEELLRNNAERQQPLAGIAASLETFRARVQHGLAAATFEQRRQLVLLLVDRVIVTNAEVEIRYVLPTSPESEHVRFCHLRKDYFDHPAPRLLTRMLFLVELSTTATDMTDIAPLRGLPSRTRIIIAQVQAQMLNQSCPRGATGDQSVERFGQKQMVIAVGRSERERHPIAVDQQRSFHALFAAVGRIAPDHLTARQGRLGQAAIDRKPTPVEPLHFIVTAGGHSPEPVEEPRPDPLLEAAVGGRA
jgi:hypothetical protein